MAVEHSVERRREREGVRFWTVFGVGLGTALFLVATLGLLSVYVRWMGAPPNSPPQPTRFPEPHLQRDEAGELRALQREQAAQVEGYAWEDREKGLLRIPVSRAMAILAARGPSALDPLEAPTGIPLPVRPETPAP